ncbi:MAG: PD40 domain-containing protein [Deltaproteobacteria bacterium]|nr:PD40 domain-containing protein [Deltaproteobacteria bacterium]
MRVPTPPRAALIASLALGAFACDSTAPPGSSYYSERISPILNVGCAQQTNGCHIDLDGNATGNLDLSSFDALMRRDDVLPAYGPYPVGLLLLKGSDDVEITVETWDADPTSGERFARIETDIRHNAGSLLDIGSAGYAELKRWIESGAQRTGVPDESLSSNQGSCVNGVPEFEGFDPSVDPSDSSYADFRLVVQPMLRETCAGSDCHGQELADLYLTCGDNEQEIRWNYFAAMSHVTTPVSTSGLLRRPLTTFRGGSFHEGGNVFAGTDDERYQILLAWAEDIATRAPELLRDDDPDPGLRFFANRVQPVLVREGCMFLNCHSPSMFHDLRLRGGDQGVFSRIATRRNYDMSRELLAVESPDPNAGRLVAKNLFPFTQVDGAQGIAHRGGSLFEDFSTGGVLNPATVDDCATFDADTGDLNEVPPYCVIARWHEIEREEAAASGEILPVDQVIDGLVWVARPPGVGDPLDFDTFRGGADLRFATATVDAAGATSLDASSSLLGGCGLAGDLDVRTPAVSWDGSRIAFAVRSGASEPLRLYWMNSDGTGCEPVPGLDTPASENGILIHDFDPAFAPDDRLVFASTRGNVDGAVDYRGPTRTPAAMAPNANLFVREDDGVRQLTFLLNQELAPSFMRDGRLIFSTQKRQPGFSQIALRRQNLDGGDYHPLFAQRGTVGFPRAFEVVELAGGNDYAFVGGPLDAADGAGTIVIANRSIGPDQAGRDPGERAYLHSMSVPVPGAFGAIANVPAGPGGNGAFRSPAALPTGRLVASCDLAASDLRAGPFAFQLCEIDPKGESVRAIGGDAGMANVEAVAVYGRGRHHIFHSRFDEANGASLIDSGFAPSAEVHFLDFPLLETLLFSNVRGPRVIDPAVGGVRLYEVRPPPQTASSFGEVMGNVVSDEFGMVFVDERDIGFVPLLGDGSARVLFGGGVPFRMAATNDGGDVLSFDAEGAFMGDRVQREQMQVYPGERLRQSFPRRFFNGLCGTCHGSVSGRELDVAVEPDVLTSATETYANETDPVDLR